MYDLWPDFSLYLVAKQLLGKDFDAVWLILLLSLMLLFIVVGSVSLWLQFIYLGHVRASSHCRGPIPTIFLWDWKVRLCSSCVSESVSPFVQGYFCAGPLGVLLCYESCIILILHISIKAKSMLYVCTGGALNNVRISRRIDCIPGDWWEIILLHFWRHSRQLDLESITIFIRFLWHHESSDHSFAYQVWVVVSLHE